MQHRCRKVYRYEGKKRNQAQGPQIIQGIFLKAFFHFLQPGACFFLYIGFRGGSHSEEQNGGSEGRRNDNHDRSEHLTKQKTAQKGHKRCDGEGEPHNSDIQKRIDQKCKNEVIHDKSLEILLVDSQAVKVQIMMKTCHPESQRNKND